MKRLLIDIIPSFLAVILLSPLFLIIAIWIKFDSEGPVLFKQIRIGRNKQPFYILKFRSMYFREDDSVDQKKEKVIASNNDSRITRVGKFLRVTSLDEIPQLFNVLKGEMSIVGPRPIIPDQLEVVPERFSERFKVSPGITGLSQVRGRRSLSWENQLLYDVEYVKNCNFYYDLKIILLTVKTVLKKEGIYADDSKNWRSYLNRKDWK